MAKKKKNDDIIIQTPNKDVIASYIFALSRKKEVTLIEQRAVLRIVEYAQDYGLKGLRIKDNMRQIDLGLDRVKINMPITDIALNSHYKPEDVDKALKDLRSRAFIYRYKDADGHPVSLISGVLDKAIVEYGKGTVTLEVDNQVWKMITNFSLGFREFELNKALSLPTSYALQFYMMITGQKRPYFMSVEELKDWLGIDPDKYTKDGKHRIDHLEERILVPAQKALNETCPYSFTYTKIRENPKNPRSKVIGFNFTPVFLAKNRDPELAKAGLLSRLHSSTFIASRTVRDILRNKIGFSSKELDPHVALFDDVSKFLPDPERTITEIYDRSRATNPTNPKGYLINALRNEVEEAKKGADKKKEPVQTSFLSQPKLDMITISGEVNTVLSALERFTKPKKEIAFKREQLLETYNECHLDISLDEWAKSMGYKWDESRKMFVK